MLMCRAVDSSDGHAALWRQFLQHTVPPHGETSCINDWPELDLRTGLHVISSEADPSRWTDSSCC